MTLSAALASKTEVVAVVTMAAAPVLSSQSGSTPPDADGGRRAAGTVASLQSPVVATLQHRFHAQSCPTKSFEYIMTQQVIKMAEIANFETDKQTM